MEQTHPTKDFAIHTWAIDQISIETTRYQQYVVISNKMPFLGKIVSVFSAYDRLILPALLSGRASEFTFDYLDGIILCVATIACCTLFGDVSTQGTSLIQILEIRKCFDQTDAEQYCF